ncbi:MAG: hypothetical protein HYW45_03585 [Candidatus Daviesbacteria bacterium]|nr:MAG: hypothetical protein HYW45_03585 [Candidatus Daviesbacteria bacterium]
MVAKILLAGDPQARIGEIDNILASLNINRNHPDLLFIPADSKLGINEAKKIKEHFAFKPVQAKGKVAVLEDAATLTQVAQNTLLKTLEELPESGLVILGANSESYFLPTILSRCEIIRKYPIKDKVPTESTYGVDYKKDIEKLLKSSLEEQFKYIEKLEERGEFLDGLIFYFRDQLTTNPEPATQFLKTLFEAKKWFKQNVNQRAILEYLMLKMPKPN